MYLAQMVLYVPCKGEQNKVSRLAVFTYINRAEHVQLSLVNPVNMEVRVDIIGHVTVSLKG